MKAIFFLETRTGSFVSLEIDGCIPEVLTAVIGVGQQANDLLPTDHLLFFQDLLSQSDQGFIACGLVVYLGQVVRGDSTELLVFPELFKSLQ